MAATDQTYRDQKRVDIVFGVSCIVMLLSVFWMFYDDYYRPFKVEIRKFRDVDTALAERQALADLPDPDRIQELEQEVEQARAQIDQQELDKIKAQAYEALAPKVRAEAAYQAMKADYDSLVSLYNIEVEQHGPRSSKALSMKTRIVYLEQDLARLQADLDQKKGALDPLLKRQTEIEQPLTEALARLKRANDEFDRAARNAAIKRWGWGDWVRSWPVIDGFASPYRIQQYTLETLTIDYNFKQVTRYDRCTTCHQGIDKPAFTKKNLRDLAVVPQLLQDKLERARELVRRRAQLLQGTGESLGYSADDLRLNSLELSDKHVNEFCAHPRLDLFVDANSPHPAEKFGCTICHAGQGSATEFILASHTPNNARQKHEWEKDYHWKSHHYWDFPMLPKRFLEASCVKCHHQITDLIREGSKNEAPKLLRGYNLVRENGCFGCHEIAGIKNGRWVGPDLRLEPYPPLDDLTPEERAQALADPLNPPGTMRKVGPSLRRISEKTNPEWVAQWIRAPRDFRPDTKMPHFYGLSNNSREALHGTDQEKFPDAEIRSITFYLFKRSQSYLRELDEHHQLPPEKLRADRERFEALRALHSRTEEQKKELEVLTARLQLNRAQPMLPESALPPLPADAKARQEQLTRGRQLFTEKGCLACHTHQGTETSGQGLPAITSDAHFAPNLSRLADKLGTRPGDPASARRWLVQWIMNPNVYHPRTFMPITHLTIEQASDIAAWLLSQRDPAEMPAVAEPTIDTLKALARVHLEKILTQSEIKHLLNPKSPEEQQPVLARLAEMGQRGADEGELAGGIDETHLKLYIGRKAISQLGCFGCHDIPGFETAKPIGTPLNDWGKKDPERLAFEDAIAYVHKHFYATNSPRVEEKEHPNFGKPYPMKEGKKPYEKFFIDLLSHHQREGFLSLKLMDPRSYDYNRLRRWDERLRMPQFRFARTVQHEDETDEDYAARRDAEEAEAREAVMTFILGLVAEPIPSPYVNQPRDDRRAEVLGRQVLDKYNCAGCHLVRPGVYEFKPTPAALEQLERSYQTESRNYPADFNFHSNNAWTGTLPPRTDRLKAFGVRPQLMPDPDDESRSLLVVRLTQALRFERKEEGQQQVRDLRAAGSARLLPDDLVYPSLADRTEGERLAILREQGPYGGAFADILAPWLIRLNPQKYRKGADGDSSEARAAVPPALLREGEKTQPEWLYRFLRNPEEIRPMAILRMPRFNMSDDEAMALVNYFSAADRVSNPGAGIRYPYLTVPQQDEAYWQQKTAEYVNRLKARGQYEQRLRDLQPVWEDVLRRRLIPTADDQVAAAQQRIASIQQQIAQEKDASKLPPLESSLKDAEKALQAAQDEAARLKRLLEQRDFSSLDQEWTHRQAYAADAWRLLANTDLCLKCHQVGILQPNDRQGPPLNLAWQRLRPEWTERWIANPDRFLTYPSIMPQNFPANKPTEFQQYFVGTPLDQVTAVRDALMFFPRVSEMPVNRLRPVAGGGK
jgi:mono/diheme cytochrome c family protein